MQKESEKNVFISGVTNQISCKPSSLNRLRVKKSNSVQLDKWLLEQKAKLAPFRTPNSEISTPEAAEIVAMI